jgi:hypothetical protein
MNTALTRDRHLFRQRIRTHIPTSERPQTNALDGAATGIVFQTLTLQNYVNSMVARSRVICGVCDDEQWLRPSSGD